MEFTLKGLLEKRIDSVEVNRLETWVAVNQQSPLSSMLLDRSLLVLKRFNELYPPKENVRSDHASSPLPELVFKRSCIEFRGDDGFKSGAVDIDTLFGFESGKLKFKGEYTMPGGRRAVFKSVTDLKFSKTDSSLAAGFNGTVDLRNLVDQSLSFSPGSLDFTGDLHVRQIAGELEWDLKLELPPVKCALKMGNFDLHSILGGDIGVVGSSTHISSRGKFGLSSLTAVCTSADGSVGASGTMEGIGFDLHLPLIEFKQFSSAAVLCQIGVSNLSVSAGDFVMDQGVLESTFTTKKEGIEFGDSVLHWRDCTAFGLHLKPLDLALSIDPGVLLVKAGLSVEGESMEMHANCEIPFGNPLSGTLKVDVPEVILTSDGQIGALIAKKFSKSHKFNGLFSASAMLESLNSLNSFSGEVSLKDGEFSMEELQISGVELNMPVYYNGKIGSTGTPVLRVSTVDAGNIALSDGELLFHLRADELFVESVHIGWAKGDLQTHSIHIGFDGSIRNEFTVYADKVDLGEVFTLVMPFQGRMEGVLYGRFPVDLQGKRVKLSVGFLYSLPGQGGVLKLDNPTDMEGLLERAGISRKLKAPLSYALSDLVFSAIRFDLENKGFDDSTLRIKLDGESKYEKWPAPVDLNINLHGPLDSIINIGMDMQRFNGGG